MIFSIAALLTLVGIICRQTYAYCECGYSLNNTKEPQHAVFTDLLESDFLHLKEIKDNSDWVVQSYVTKAPSNSAYGKNASIANVETNPIAKRHQYSGPGIHGPDPGLQLYVRPVAPGGSVPIAEVVSKRTDMMHGSFRISMKFGGIDGTCASMFFYFNDTNEIDMEFLSTLTPKTGNTAPMWLVLHSTTDSPFQQHQLPFLPQDGYHEYRFDWMPDRVSYFVDEVWQQDFTTGLPKMPGSLHMFHWSTGDPNWSRGPPTKDAVQTVSYVKAYFNSTDHARQTAYEKRCTNPSAHNAICEIPKLSGPPDPAGRYHMSWFFTEQHNHTEGQINYVPPQ